MIMEAAKFQDVHGESNRKAGHPREPMAFSCILSLKAEEPVELLLQFHSECWQV